MPGVQLSVACAVLQSGAALLELAVHVLLTLTGPPAKVLGQGIPTEQLSVWRWVSVGFQTTDFGEQEEGGVSVR